MERRRTNLISKDEDEEDKLDRQRQRLTPLSGDPSTAAHGPHRTRRPPGLARLASPPWIESTGSLLLLTSSRSLAIAVVVALARSVEYDQTYELSYYHSRDGALLLRPPLAFKAVTFCHSLSVSVSLSLPLSLSRLCCARSVTSGLCCALTNWRRRGEAGLRSDPGVFVFGSVGGGSRLWTRLRALPRGAARAREGCERVTGGAPPRVDRLASVPVSAAHLRGGCSAPEDRCWYCEEGRLDFALLVFAAKAMAAVAAMRSGSGSGSDGGGGGYDKGGMDSGKYVRYTPEQVEALERVYAECPKPTSTRRQQLLRECPILANIEPRQIKVWFQNRRCRDKQRKESSRLQAVNRKLSAMNKLLMEENERLQKQVSQLVYENAYMKQQLQSPSLANDPSSESNVTIPQNPLRDASNPSGLLSIAEETLTEFLSKATGTAVDWVPMPGMKPGPDSFGIVAISHGCRGVAARACGLVNLEPTKIVEVLKDRPSWFRDCRSLEVFTMLPAGNGGTIELIYMQMYAPTTLVPARDFWTLRYTTTMEDGSLVVCERSLSGSGGGPSTASAQQFVRAEMLPSGYLVRPCDGGGSIVHIVDHLDLEAWSVPEVLRPLYESSRVVAQKMTTAALRHIRQIAQETSGEIVYAFGRQPAVLRTFSQRLSRGFNDAISGFNDDGWSVMGGDGIEDVTIACNLKKIRNNNTAPNAFGSPGGVICAKASMLLQSVPPAVLVRFLREHRSEWADYNFDAYSASALKTSSCSLPGLRPMRFSGSQIMPLAHTVENEEILEVVRLEGQALDEGLLSRDIHLLQFCTGIDEKSMGSCFQLVFAPIDELFPDDAPLISSGFRVIPLDMKTDGAPAGRTLDLASSLEVGSTTPASGDASLGDSNLRSVLTIAFQFPYEMHLQDSVATMARQYVRSIVSAVQRVSMAISPSRPGLNAEQKIISGFPEAGTLARWICQSYQFHLGVELLWQADNAGESLLRMLWDYEDAILCCSFKEKPVFTFANEMGINMLETSFVALQDLSLDKIFDEAGRKALYSEIPKLMEQGYVYLPAGVCLSGMGRHVSFEQAIAWKVLGEDNNVHCLAFCFVNWSFV